MNPGRGFVNVILLCVRYGSGIPRSGCGGDSSGQTDPGGFLPAGGRPKNQFMIYCLYEI